MSKPVGTVKRAMWGKGLFPHQFSWLIDNPIRRLLITPETLAGRLPLTESSRILEVGPGSGYFSRAIAPRVPRGRLDLVDIQREMLTKAKRKLDALGVRNVGYVNADAGGGLPFPNACFDLVVLVSVLGEIEQRAACLASLFRVLRPGGVLACHESVPDPDRIPVDHLCREAREQGFDVQCRWGPRWNYTVAFLRPTAAIPPAVSPRLET